MTTNSTWVYFIVAYNRVKIGWTTDLAGRVFELQAECPLPARLVAAIPNAGPREEGELHRKFDEHRLHREWFRIVPEIQALMDKHALPEPLECYVPWARRNRCGPKLQLSEEERQARRERAIQLHKEGRLGGADFGKLGGRPTHRPPTSQVHAS